MIATRGWRTGSAVREIEILRLSAMIAGRTDVDEGDVARRSVLAWAQNRCGGKLPQEAWNQESFQYFSAGRNSSGIRIRTNGTDIWAFRAEDPDKEVPGRVWTTEVVVAMAEGLNPRLGVWLLASTSERELFIEPHVPGFVLQIADTVGLHRDGYDFYVEPWLVNGPLEVDLLFQHILDQNRQFPLFVLSSTESDITPESSLINARSLSRATLVIGKVAVVSAESSWALTERFGQPRSVHSGAVRAYLPGFTPASNPFDHRLVLPAQLGTSDEQSRVERWMRSLAATESVRRIRLGQDVYPFSSIRDAAFQVQQQQLTDEGASEEELLRAADARIAALESDIRREKEAQEYFAQEADDAAERAQAAESQFRASTFYIQQLQQRLEERGEPLDEEAIPQTWADFCQWCDTVLVGRVILTPTARRNCKNPAFQDVALAARCLRWLAKPYRDGRINGSKGDFVDYPIEDGIRNSFCGSDEFDFMWEGRRQTADWHIKNGGNTRDPQLCFRIYYCWEPDTSQVIVADMPAHRSNSNS